MITCSVCGTANQDFAVTCSSCKSYIQSKIENLDLFETLWGLIESPGRTFKKIVLARHKNYILLLSSLLGMAAVYALIWYKNWGGYFSNVLTLTGTGLVIGMVLGPLLVVALSTVIHVAVRPLGGMGTWKNMLAVVAYAGAPVVLSLVLVFPLELAIFGPYFFENNPPPLVLNPLAYILVMGLDGAAFLWSWILLAVGTSVANTLHGPRSVLATIALAVLTGCTAYVARAL